MGLLEAGADDGLADAPDLDVHLEGGDALGRAGDLEVHVTEGILLAEDVGQHAKRSPSSTRPIAAPATGALIGTPASMSARVEPQVDAIEVEPLDVTHSLTRRMTYGKSCSRRQHRQQRPLRERAVADLTPARAAHRLVLAGAVRRHVVVMQVALGLVRADRVDPLDVRRGAQRRDGQRLRVCRG